MCQSAESLALRWRIESAMSDLHHVFTSRSVSLMSSRMDTRFRNRALSPLGWYSWYSRVTPPFATQVLTDSATLFSRPKLTTSASSYLNSPAQGIFQIVPKLSCLVPSVTVTLPTTRSQVPRMDWDIDPVVEASIRESDIRNPLLPVWFEVLFFRMRERERNFFLHIQTLCF